MIVVGLVSTYREGRLARAAIQSVLQVGLDCLYIYEGPAGDPLPNESELPETWLPEEKLSERGAAGGPDDSARVVIHRGRWRSDGRKRNEMLQRVKTDYGDDIVWAVTVDADEVLLGAEYLRDRLDWIEQSNAHRGASIATPDNPPLSRWPLRLIEHEGSMSVITARVYRADLLRSIDHSTSIVTNVAGVREGWGNYADTSKVWIELWLAAIDRGAMVAWPPLPCEPAILHRSNLRNPARAGLRMSDQETREFARAQADEARAADLDSIRGIGARDPSDYPDPMVEP